ncbi:MAG: TonB-dependent receptor domain-containing protein [Thalassotalea sp.]
MKLQILNINTKKTIISAALVNAVALTTPSVLAKQASADELEQITVTASRSAMNIDDSLASQILITRRDIEAIQATSILDVLTTVAGIDLANNGGRGQTSSVYMRGANANHTLILIDGIRLSSATLGSTDIQSISPELIERIEIVKGPRAALWGSDAIGGVIQIFTRKLAGGEHFAGLTIGEDNLKQARVGFGVDHGEGSTSVLLNHEQNDGFDVLTAAEPDDDGYKRTSVAVKGEQKISDEFAVDWLFSAVQGNSDYDSTFGGTNKSEINNHAWLLRAKYSANKDNVTQFYFGQNRDSDKKYGNGTSRSDGNLIQTRRDQVSIINNSMFANNFKVSLGLDYAAEDISSATAYIDTERDVLGVFAHGFYQLEQASFELAVRHDDVEHMDEETTFNAGAGYQFSDLDRLVLNVGTGFKAPTFNDLYWPAGLYSAGNPDLIAETSETVELVYTTEYSGIQLGFTGYQTDVENLIDWAKDENGFWQPQNVDQVEITGLEFTALYAIDDSSHQFNASYTDAQDQATGKQLERRAKQQFSYIFSTELDGVQLNAEYKFNGKRYDSGDVKLNSYQLVNLRASYDVTQQFSVQVKLENALNKDYTTANGYNTPDRAFYLSVNYQNF